ncbi:MAG: hypothetical protein ABI080_05900 [Candidatus Binatia bacterium]
MPPTATERCAVWEALSELFLDTGPSIFTESNAGVLAASPYSIAELESILLWELYPALWRNLAMVAGEWRGFDGEWLQAQVAQRASRSSRWHTAIFGRWWIARSSDWRALKRKIAERRAAV